MGSGPELRPKGDTLEVRYDRVRKQLVPRFLDRHRLTVVGLAKLIDVDRSSLTRFLNGVEGYTPTPSRPGKLEMLEKLEALCSRMHIRMELDEVLLSRGSPDGGPETDDDVMFRHFTERIFALEEKYEPAVALLLLPEFRSYALNAPAPYGASMCSNLLLVIAGIVDQPGIADASAELLRSTLAGVAELERRAKEVATETFQRTARQHPIGNAGACYAKIGLQLDDKSILAKGMDGLLAAAMTPHSQDERHWPRLLTTLEQLLQSEHRDGKHWSERTARSAMERVDATLIDACSGASFPLVLSHWASISKELVEALTTTERSDRE